MVEFLKIARLRSDLCNSYKKTVFLKYVWSFYNIMHERVKGCFGNSSLLEDQKYPVLLRTFSYFTNLAVLNAHEKVLHGGLRITLNHI